MDQDLTRLAREIFDGVVEACDAGRAVSRRVSGRPGVLAIPGVEVDVSAVDEVRVAAVGKGADAMALAVDPLLAACGLGAAPRRGVVVAHVPPVGRLPAWAERLVGGHPTPTAESFEAGRLLLELFSGCTERTLALFLLSGGGSALAEWPARPELAPADLVELNTQLVRSDLDIRQINAVRKRVSAIKGGRLAAHAAPALQVTLIVSDVAPGDLQSVASGPTLPDETTWEDATAALRSAGLYDRLPARLARALAPEALAGAAGGEATPRGHHAAVLDSSDAERIAARLAGGRGARVRVLGDGDGPLEAVADAHLAALEAHLGPGQGGVAAVVSAGEVTLDVRGGGLGGRNQQTVLYAITRAHELCPSAADFAILSAGTDGRDGPTDAAGAVAGPETLARALALGLDPPGFIENNDAYHFFQPLDALVRTGPTGTNVRDVRLILGLRR
jgi:hydroxypyruvate reductase